jgi:predicted RNA-binding Zn-ribbon protein involved in translation (DUF1610 family)
MKRSKVKKVDIDNKNKPVIISNSDNEVKEYVCDSCNFIIRTRLTDGEITCYHCGNVIEIQETRKRSKLETPHKNTETLVSTTPMPGDVAIKKPPNYKGSFAELHKKGR